MSLIEVPPRIQPLSWALLCAAGCIGLLGAVVFVGFPQLDIAFSRLFYSGGKFLFAEGATGTVLRELFRWLFILACIAALVGFAAIAFASRRLLRFGFAAWLYVILTAAVGPGLVANLIFKDHWGRARPHHTVEFGGTKQFTAALVRSNQCAKNCSFVSGEASNIFAIGFALTLLAGARRRRWLFLATIVAGLCAGVVRIGAGAHFLSDVFFAGIFMAFVARSLYWLLFERYEAFFADEGPFHRRTLYTGQRGAERAARLMERARQSRLMERARELSRRGPKRP
jgi:lipid A 4'-phosphatase